MYLFYHACYSEKRRKDYNKVTTIGILKIKIQVRSHELVSPGKTSDIALEV